MKIAFTILDITYSNGTERTTSLLANEFHKQGHEVSIISVFRTGKMPGFQLNPGINIKYLVHEEYSHSNGFYYIFKQYIKAIKHIREYYSSNHVDIIIGQAFLTNFFLWLSGYAKIAIACEHFKYGMYTPSIRFFRNHIYRGFKKVVVLTDNDASTYQKHNIDAEVIPNMVSFEIEDIHKDDCKRIISVGRLHHQKGYDLLLPALKQVFKKHPDWNMVIYGEGDDRVMLEQLCCELDITQNVNLPGFSIDIRHEYRNSSFYVMSSRYEGLPMVLLEAMACGLPVISFDCPEGPRTILSGNSGILVPAEDINALSDAIIRMIEQPTLRSEYSSKSLNVAKEYSPNEIYNKWQLLLKHLNP